MSANADHNADDDDDDSSDSDYDPSKDKTDKGSDCDDEDTHVIAKVRELKDISFSKKRQVDSIWDEMNAADKTETQQRLEKVRRQPASKGSTSKNKSSKAEKMLAGIFGKSQASLIIGSSSGTGGRRSCSDEAGGESLKETIQKSVQSLQKRQKVNETRKFAGQNIT